MKVIGITGGVGAGKTQVLEYLNNKYGATICQTDLVAKIGRASCRERGSAVV